MLDAIEQLMTWIRRVKLFLTLAAVLLPLMAAGLLVATGVFLNAMVTAGNQLQKGMIRDDLAALGILIGLGYMLRLWFKAGKESSWVADLMASFTVGVIGFCMIFYLIPALAHTVAQVVVAPALAALGNYFAGGAVVSLETILRWVFAGYLATWVIDVAVTKFLRKQDISASVARLLRRYGQEVVECLEDIGSFVAWMFRAVFGKKEQGD